MLVLYAPTRAKPLVKRVPPNRKAKGCARRVRVDLLYSHQLGGQRSHPTGCVRGKFDQARVVIKLAIRRSKIEHCELKFVSVLRRVWRDRPRSTAGRGRYLLRFYFGDSAAANFEQANKIRIM